MMHAFENFGRFLTGPKSIVLVMYLLINTKKIFDSQHFYYNFVFCVQLSKDPTEKFQVFVPSGLQLTAALNWMGKLILQTLLWNAARSRIRNSSLCRAFHKKLLLFTKRLFEQEQFQSSLKSTREVRCLFNGFFRKVSTTNSNSKWTTENKYGQSLLAACPIVLKWRGNIFPLLHSSIFSMILLCSAVSLAIFFSVFFIIFLQSDMYFFASRTVVISLICCCFKIFL